MKDTEEGKGRERRESCREEEGSTGSHSTSKRSMSSEHALVLTLVAFHFTS